METKWELLLNFSMISDSDILLIRFSFLLKMVAGTTAMFSDNGVYVLGLSANLAASLISRS